MVVPYFTTKDGAEIYCKDWGQGPSVVFNHAYGVNSDSWENQMFFLATRGYRCIAFDRRGHGRSSQPWEGNDLDTYADDLAELMERLDLRDSVLVGHSTGGGVLARYIGRHGTGRVAKAVFIGATVPLLQRTQENPEGVPLEVIDQYRQDLLANRPEYFKNMLYAALGANRPGAGVSQDILDAWWNMTTLTGFPAAYYAIEAFAEDDTSEDLKRIDVPTLILHGDDDQVIPVRNAHLSSRLIPDAKLKVYPGGSHCMIIVNTDEVNADLIDFLGK
ncbi:alpha/beta fold hydrolase [Streptomyces sp. NPDC056672]|uniref:alpha/beta fold hydrolase n=1 Tax=Streptomyces sp. NPDC056672 TaxID=3345906 RepID=UPI0036C4B308